LVVKLVPLARLGKLQTGTTQSQEFAFYGLNGGLNIKSAPQSVADNELTVAQDGYLRADGGFQMRNGMQYYSQTATGGTGQLILARFYQDVQNGVQVSPETVQLLGQVGNSLYNISSSGVWTGIGSIHSSTAANPMTWCRIQQVESVGGGGTYTSGLTDCMVICTGSGGPYVYDGTTLYTPPGWSSATSASWCAVVNGILWFGGIPLYPNQIFGTGDGITAPFETLPAYRNFVLSSFVTGLCAQGTGASAALVIGMSNGLSMLYGTGPSTFYRQDVPLKDGVTAGRTMVYDAGNVYFLGQRAIYRFDGQTIPVSISDKVEPWILNDQFTLGYPMTNRSYAWAQVYNNRLHVGYIANGGTYPNTMLVYDLVVGGWTVLQPYSGISSMCLLDAPTDADPYVAIVGSATTGLPLTWDYVPTPTTTVVYDDAPNNANPVLASVRTKYFKLGVPGTTKALQRFYPEMLVGGPFSQPFAISTDYGSGGSSTPLVQPTYGGGVWDTSGWDAASWGGVYGFLNFGPPDSRLDFAGIEAESFAFGITMVTASAPWVWSGGTGVFHQRGRT
jgi:hypothetical protein